MTRSTALARLFAPLAALILCAAQAWADDQSGVIYDAAANGPSQIDAALTQASERGIPGLIVFGANWCHDSRGFAERISGGDSTLSAFMAEHYAVAFVDIGMRHRNLDQAVRFGVEAIHGTPTLVIADGEGAVLNAGTVHDWRAIDGAGHADLLAYFARFAGAPAPDLEPVYRVYVQTAAEAWPPYVSAVEAWLAAYEAGEIDAETLGRNAAYAGGLARSMARHALGQESRARDEALADGTSLIHLGVEPAGDRTDAVIARMADISMDIPARLARDRADTAEAMETE